MRINITKKDILWNYIGTVFQMGINYLILPFLLYFFDADTLGIWYVYMNLANVATLFIFGFSPTFARNIAYCWSGKKNLDRYGASSFADTKQDNVIDSGLFNTLMSTCRLIYLIVALVALLILSTIGTIYIFHIGGYLFESSNIKISWIILLAAIFLNLYYGYYISALSGVGEIANRSKAHVYANIIRILLTGILLFMGFNLSGACAAYLIYGFALRFFCKHYFEKAIKKEGIIYHRVSIGEIKKCFDVIWPNSWRDGMVSTSDYLCTQAGTIVASLFLPLSATGVFSLSTQLVTAVGKISRSYQIAKIPSLQAAFISDNKSLAKKINSMCITIFSGVYIIGIIGVVFVASPIIEMIKPEIEINDFLILLIALSQFIIVYRNCYASFLSTTNKVDYWLSFVLSGVLAIVLSVVFIKYLYLGVNGIVIATIVSELIFNAWYWPKKVNDELGIGVVETFRIGVKNIFEYARHQR